MASHAVIPLKKYSKPPVSVWHVFTLCFVSMVIALAFTIFYVKHVQDQSTKAVAVASRKAEQQREATLRQLCLAMDVMQQEYSDLGTPNASDIALTWGQMEKLVGCKGH